ncbi:MAG: outer membrane lipoprotein LolB [Geobacteraceae bacterium]
MSVSIATAALIILSGCSTAPKPLAGLVQGREVETLQSRISVAIRTPGSSQGGRGYLRFKRPGSFHVAIISPFGPTMLELFITGDRITCLLPSKQIAYAGRLAELPEKEGLRSWGLMRWVVEQPPPVGRALSRENVMADGRRESVSYGEQGIILRKETEDGYKVSYLDYHVVNGVAFPSVMEISTPQGGTIRIIFNEPLVNQPVEEEALSPTLEGFTVLPFSAFKGF